ncbi:MAG: branched-chain amino acid ABC transporter substrate-binding protein [Chloroflexota bacterium]
MTLLLSACGAAGSPPASASQPAVQIRAISTNETPTPAASASPNVTSAPCPSPTTPAPSPSAASAIKLGLMAPFSGLAAAFGQDMLKGGQMALDEANGAGGIGGKRVLFDQADDRGDAAAPSAAQKLVTDGVAAVIGPASSASALAAEGVLNQAKLSTITPSANDPRITDEGLPFIFRAAGRWDQEPPLVADFLLKQPATAKIALVADKSEYGQTLVVAMRQALAKANAQPAADETIDSGAKDLGPLVAKLKAQSPGAVFYAGYAADGGALAKALRAAGVQAALAMGDAAQDQALIASAGAAAEGLTFAFPPDPKQIPTAATLLDAYKRRYGTAASLYAISTYDTVRLVLDALRRAGSIDGEAVRQAVAASDFSSLYWGKMGFDAKGDLRARTYALWTVRNGKFELKAVSQ